MCSSRALFCLILKWLVNNTAVFMLHLEDVQSSFMGRSKRIVGGVTWL